MVALRQGDYEVAQHHYADCLAIARKFGDEEAVAEALVNLGVATINLGDPVQAKSLFAESVSLSRESGNKSRLAESFYYFGFLALFEVDKQQAKSFFEQELALARTVGPTWLGAQALRGLAGVAATGGQLLRGARLLGAAEARAEAAATYNDAVNSQLIGLTIATAMAQLGEAAFEQAREEGRAMTFEQAVEYALEED
jgi:non-specific serine/threonine protein kinase